MQALLASDAKVRDWYNEKALRSHLSADTYTRMLVLLSERLGMSPETIVTSAKKSPDKLRVKLTGCAFALKKDGWLDTSISKGFLMLKAYLKYRHVSTDVFPRLSSTTGETLQKERVPTQEELAMVLDKLSLRGRVTALFMAHCGLRPQVLGLYQAENGLRLRDLPELKLQGRTVIFNETPFVVRVPAALSKTRASYTTFGTSQLATAFLAYLGERREGGEKLTPDSPVIASHPTRGSARAKQVSATFSNGFLTTSVLMREIHDALTSSLPEGVTWRPYVLRAYCSTRLLMAEGAGKITRDLREALLGHDLGVSGRYTLGKAWGPDLLKEARSAYKRAEPYLLTTSAPDKTGESYAALLQLLAKNKYITEEEARVLTTGTPEQLAERFKATNASEPEKRHQKVVANSEADKLIEAGWEYVGPLGPEKVVMKGPSGCPLPLRTPS